MASASIHVQPVQNGSEAHNERTTELNYTYNDLSPNNASWSESRISDKQKEIETLCKEKSGRAMRKDATPIREAVVNLEKKHTIQDLKRLTTALEKAFGIKAFQIHIHRDEGKSREELNYHAHIVFDWQNKQTGKMIRLGKLDTVKMQTITADILGMERGKEKSTATRLSAQQYKVSQEIAHLKAQKKNLIEDIERKTLQHKQNMRELKQSFKQEMQSLKSPEARIPKKIREYNENGKTKLQTLKKEYERVWQSEGNDMQKTANNYKQVLLVKKNENNCLEVRLDRLNERCKEHRITSEENILSPPKPKKKKTRGMSL